MALITALLLTAIVSVLAVSMVSAQRIDIRRTQNVIDNDRAYVLALGVEAWVKHLLIRDLNNSTIDSLDEQWATVLPPIAVEGGTISGRLHDLSGRFNINNLLNAEGGVDALQKERFGRLLDGLGIDRSLVNAVIDWLDANQQANFPGAEDDEYLSYESPYRTADRPMVSPSELRLVKGVTAEVFQTLVPHVATLPRGSRINVNTATAPVLAALVEGVTPADAQAMVEAREEAPWESVAAFRQDPVFSAVITGSDPAGRGGGQRTDASPPNGLADLDQVIDVKTEYFLMDATTHFGERGRSHLYSVLRRVRGKVDVLMRSRGIY